ncbi:hypothetical protein [Neisseria sicca]|nr:hypothetical protein [Neisseria sicca]
MNIDKLSGRLKKGRLKTKSGFQTTFAMAERLYASTGLPRREKV